MEAEDKVTGTYPDEAEIRQEDLKRLSAFRLLDDTYARSYFRQHPELAEFVLRIITKISDLEIDRESFETQYDAKRAAGSRSLVMDVYGGDKSGRKFNIEVENWEAEAERAEYHVATMCMENLHAGDEFSDLPEIYVIFITEKDTVGDGKPAHHFSYRDDDVDAGDEETARNPHKSLHGRTHIIYVNGAYKDDESAIGKLMHDFRCNNADEMFYSELAERTRYLKENPKGVEEMCKVMDELRIESEKRGEQSMLVRAISSVMKSFGVSVEEAMDSLNVPIDQRAKYAGLVNARN